MHISGLHHCNIATYDLEESARFYEKLGLTRGPRPDFGNTGVWLYTEDGPVIHLNDEKEVGPIACGTGVFHHVGLKAHGSIDEVTNKLRSLGITHKLWEPAVPGWYRALYFKGPSEEEIELVLVDCFVPQVERIPAEAAA